MHVALSGSFARPSFAVQLLQIEALLDLFPIDDSQEVTLSKPLLASDLLTSS